MLTSDFHSSFITLLRSWHIHCWQMNYVWILWITITFPVSTMPKPCYNRIFWCLSSILLARKQPDFSIGNYTRLQQEEYNCDWTLELKVEWLGHEPGSQIPEGCLCVDFSKLLNLCLIPQPIQLRQQHLLHFPRSLAPVETHVWGRKST